MSITKTTYLPRQAPGSGVLHAVVTGLGSLQRPARCGFVPRAAWEPIPGVHVSCERCAKLARIEELQELAAAPIAAIRNPAFLEKERDELEALVAEVERATAGLPRARGTAAGLGVAKHAREVAEAQARLEAAPSVVEYLAALRELASAAHALNGASIVALDRLQRGGRKERP
jgi:hypothetical protein